MSLRNVMMALAALAGAGLIGLAYYLPAAPRGEAPPATARPAASGLPNVVVIVVDTLRADRLDATRNGQPVMPKLAALAREGRRFTTAISPSSHTRTAIASLMTGQYVDAHGVYFGAHRDNTGAMSADHLGEAWTTLAEALRGAGYDNLGFVANGNAQGGSGYGQGFDEGRYLYHPEMPAAQVTDLLLAQVESLPEPFHLFALYLDPHAPYFPPEPYRAVFGEGPALTESDRDTLREERQIPYLVLHVQQMLGQRLAERFEPLSEAGRETMRLWYDGECRYIDDEVARLIEGIRARHPNTIIVFTSDHGEEFWEHEGMGHGTTLYQEQLRVPLFILGPKVAPEVIDSPVSTVGIYKTVMRRLGLDDQALQGEDLLGGAFEGLAFARTRGPSSDQQVDLDAAQQGALKALRDAGRLYEYDLDVDPGERAPRPGSAESLRRLDEHREQNAARRVGGTAGSKPLSREDIEQLEALGYLQGQ